MTPQDPTMPKALRGRDKDAAWLRFLLLSGLFIASLVTCNLVFRKFFTWDIGAITFEQSVGLLPYPITFLVTDMISEIYGKRKANLVVLSGLAASIMTLGVVTLGGWAEATAWSPVSNEEFDHVLAKLLAVGQAWRPTSSPNSSMSGFSTLEIMTQGKILAQEQPSTIPSQIVDTSTVLVCSVQWAKSAGNALERFSSMASRSNRWWPLWIRPWSTSAWVG